MAAWNPGRAPRGSVARANGAVGKDGAVFTGTHVNGLDAKGRVSSPADFRAQAIQEGLEGVYVWPAMDGRRLDGCGAELMGRYEQLLRQSDPVDGPTNPTVNTILARARVFKFDATGRITVPKKLVDFAGLGDQAVFVGRGDRFEIWSVDGWDTQSAAESEAALDEAQLKAELASLERHVALMERRNALRARARAAADQASQAGDAEAGHESGEHSTAGVYSSDATSSLAPKPSGGDDV